MGDSSSAIAVLSLFTLVSDFLHVLRSTLLSARELKAAASARNDFGPVCTEKSDSAILVMKTAEDRLRCDDAEALNRARERGIFAQRAMNSRLVVISGVGF
jgi:hypothetical protein